MSTSPTTVGADTRSGSHEDSDVRAGTGYLGAYLALGMVLGIVALKTELVSWFRIQEMFRFQAFHMYGIIGSAVIVAAASIAVLKRLGLRTLEGEEIRTQAKVMGRGTRYWAGGTLFGVGWVLTGACPGPMFVLIGSGLGVFTVVLLSAIAGMWTYGHLRRSLPH
ncbi:MAG TPA: DUF6691 family protein [Gemmatimonadaceae bacterium]|nr:DUF6691 family protein [Gemmatimonadaceae bacterium]